MAPLTSGCEEGKFKEDSLRDELRIEKIPEIQQVRPERPVRIKLKRDAQGRYSWELSGDNPDEIIRIDKRLRKTFVPEESGQ
ncbi:MAG: hypothetical protein ACK4TF_01365 [Thermodesulfovibrionales bacterium]